MPSALSTMALGFLAAADKTPKPSRTKNNPSPKPSRNTDDTTTIDGLDQILAFIGRFWIPLAVIATWIGILYGWSRLRAYFAQRGKPVPPLGYTIKGIIRFALIEDNRPLITRPKKIAARTRWLQWRLVYLLLTITAIALWATRHPWAAYITAAIALTLLYRARKTWRIRWQIRSQMFGVAAAECKYPRGSELNPWAYINITRWDDLYRPGVTIITYPPGYNSEDLRARERFERNFTGSVSDEHSYLYTWESAKNRVTAKPSPYLPARAPYPYKGNSEHPWDEIPIGIAAGGKEAIVPVTVAPHVLIAGPTGSGKLLSLSTKIATPSGWTTMGELQAGDQVFDENGQPCTVTWVSDINDKPDLYEVVFSDGSVIEADAEHLWFTETRQVRASRWDANKRSVKRRPLISQERQDALRTIAEAASEGDEITLSTLADYAGVAQESVWLREIADRLGPVGEIQVVKEFHYAEQTVTQKQKVRVYPARQAWTCLLDRAEGSPSSRWAVVAEQRAAIAALAAAAGPSDEVTSSTVAQTLGLPRAAVAVDFLHAVKVPYTVEHREVQLQVPAKTVRRKGRWIRTYSTKAIIAALLERVERPAHDQRHLNSHGSVKTTAQIRDTLLGRNGERNHAIPVTKPLDLPAADLPIAPYVLGVWLGDGISRAGQFCGIDHEIAANIARLGYDTREWLASNADKSHADYRRWSSSRLRRELREQGLLQQATEQGSRKHIPSAYLRGSISQRQALLAGLLDTDGTVAPQGTVQFTNTNERLARQVHELALSLGYRASLTSTVKRSQTGTEATAFTVSWTCQESPFWLTRKTTTHRERNTNFCPERNNTRFVVDVRPIPAQPGRCIRVDSPNRLFLAGEAMIPTHNSVLQRTILMHALTSPKWRVIGIDPKRVELSAYKGYRNMVEIAVTLEKAVALLESVSQEMMRRYEEMESHAGVNHFTLLPDPQPAIMVMVDEVFTLLAPEKAKSDEGKARDELHARATVLIGHIARLGRAAGIHLVLATQRPDAAILPAEIKNNLDARVACARMDITPSLMVLDSDAATRLPLIKGRSVVRIGGEYREFQGYFLEVDEADAIVRAAEGRMTTGDPGDAESDLDGGDDSGTGGTPVGDPPPEPGPVPVPADPVEGFWGDPPVEADGADEPNPFHDMPLASGGLPPQRGFTLPTIPPG